MQRGLAALKVNVRDVGPDFNEFLDDKVKEAAVAGTARMKEKAPWRDDTGNRKDRIPGAARAALTAEPTDSPLTHDQSHKEITFSHGVDYGIWLETKQHGKHQIIMPTVKAIGEELMESLTDSLPRAVEEH